MSRRWIPTDLPNDLLRAWVFCEEGRWVVTSGRFSSGKDASKYNQAITIHPSSATGPLLNESALNSKYDTITCGVTHNMLLATIDVQTDFSVFGLIKPSADGVYQNIYESGDSIGVAAQCPMFWIDSSNSWEFNGAGTTIRSSTDSANSTWKSFATIERSSGTGAELIINGTSLGTATNSLSGGNLGNHPISLWGRNGASGLSLDAREYIITQGALTTNQEERCVGYLHWANGEDGSLAAGHTYKSAAPTWDELPPLVMQTPLFAGLNTLLRR